jgi:hypothetical protein
MFLIFPTAAEGPGGMHLAIAGACFAKVPDELQVE